MYVTITELIWQAEPRGQIIQISFVFEVTLFNGFSLGIQISKGPSCSSYRFHRMSVCRYWLRYSFEK